MISDSARVYPNVVLGKDVQIGEYCIIGVPGPEASVGDETFIGDGAIIRSFTVIYSGNQIGRGFRTGDKANIREGNIIGDDVSVGTLSVVEHHVRIGNGVRIHSQAFVPEYSILDDECWIGPNVVLTNARFPKSLQVKDRLRGPRIRRRGIVGANATLLPGVEVGERSLVGAGSVVTKDVPPGVIVAGSPARILREIDY